MKVAGDLSYSSVYTILFRIHRMASVGTKFADITWGLRMEISLSVRAVGLAALCALALPPYALAQKGTEKEAAPAFGSAAAFDPSVPSYLFAEHLKRDPGELQKLQPGVVTLVGTGNPKAVFAQWDDFQAYATCSDNNHVMCELAYFDYVASEIRHYTVPFEVVVDRDYLTQLADPSSIASRETPPRGPGVPAVRNREAASSEFAQLLSFVDAELREVEAGVIAVFGASREYPRGIYASGSGFEAYGTCTKRVTVGCWVDFFDYEAGQIAPSFLNLEEALRFETYVNLSGK